MDLITESPAEALLRCEESLLRLEQASMEAAAALREIHNLRLYAEKGYETFDLYVRQEWGIHRSRAYRLMSAHDTRVRIEHLVGDDAATISTERQLRELSGLSDGEIVDVIKTAKRDMRGKKLLTAGSLQRARRAVTGSTSNKRGDDTPPPVVQMSPNGRHEEDFGVGEDQPAVLPMDGVESDGVVARAKRVGLECVERLELQLSHLGLRGKWEAVLADLYSDIRSA